jgi:hypothetical protein
MESLIRKLRKKFYHFSRCPESDILGMLQRCRCPPARGVALTGGRSIVLGSTDCADEKRENERIAKEKAEKARRAAADKAAGAGAGGGGGGAGDRKAAAAAAEPEKSLFASHREFITDKLPQMLKEFTELTPYAQIAAVNAPPLLDG